MACAICVGLTPSYTTKLYCVFPHHANTFPLLCTLFLSPWFALAFTSYSLFLYYPFYTASLQQRTNHFPSLTTTSSSTHHTSFTYSLAVPKLKLRRHLVFNFGPTTAQTQIPCALAPGPTFVGAPSWTPYFIVWCPGSLPTLTYLHGGTAAYGGRWGPGPMSILLFLTHSLPWRLKTSATSYQSSRRHCGVGRAWRSRA